MNVNGTIGIPVPPYRVNQALHDPAILQAMLPACDGVEPLGPGRFRARIARKLGLLTLRVEPDIVLVPTPDGAGLEMSVAASSRVVGSFAARIVLTLRPEQAGTRLSWDGDLVTTGLAQRLLAERQDQIQSRVAGLFQTLRAQLTVGSA